MPCASRSLEQLRHRVPKKTPLPSANRVDSPMLASGCPLWTAGFLTPGTPLVGHWGVDLVAPANSPVKAVGPGTVIFAGFTAGGGHTVIIQHSDDRLSVYMHNSRLDVTTGDRVEQRRCRGHHWKFRRPQYRPPFAL